MKLWPLSHSASIHRGILGIAAFLVPRRERDEWRTEWTSELWYLLNGSCQDKSCQMVAHPSATQFCLGAFHDAAWLRLNSLRPPTGRIVLLGSPIQCLAFLAFLAATALLLAIRLPGVRDTLRQQPMFAHLLIVVVALVILPSTTTLVTGDYPAGGHSPTRAQRFSQWTFLAAKLALASAAVFFGTVDLATTIGPRGLQAHATLVGYVLAFRWALTDQRRRCPVCLRRLSNPVRIGQPAHVFLDWYGTELMCTEGHGLLYVPEMPTISYSSTQRWLALDASWRSLFF